jgi:hypothetical protein
MEEEFKVPAVKGGQCDVATRHEILVGGPRRVANPQVGRQVKLCPIVSLRHNAGNYQLTNSVAQEPQGSSPHSQQPATGPCPEPVDPSCSEAVRNVS